MKDVSTSAEQLGGAAASAYWRLAQGRPGE